MVIAVINSGNHGSVGNILLGIAKCSRERGDTVHIFCPPGRMQLKGIPGNQFIGTVLERRISNFIDQYTGHHGSLNWFATERFLKRLDVIKPDIIHLHGIHGNYINIKMLFRYLSKNNCRVVWTLHDCWFCTGNCPNFIIEKCEKWKTECTKCAYEGYPKGKRDIGDRLFKEKKEMFTSVKQMVLVAPSEWLADIAKESFMKDYPVKLINNGIDLGIFYPRKNDLKKKMAWEDKFIVLCVAFNWGYKKGQDRVERLADKLSDDYQVVVVGTDGTGSSSDKIKFIPRTYDQQELAELYSAADVFFNPTREDNFPTVNLEALACGTPVLSYGAGGSSEAFDEKSGMVVSDEDIVSVLERLRADNFKESDCVRRGRSFDEKEKFMEYMDIYDRLMKI